MATYNFPEVRAGQEVRTFCRECRKPLKRKISDWQTMNPFNKTADGSVKDRRTILAELGEKLTAKAAEMERDGVVCRACAA